MAEQSEICACRSGLELLCALIEEVAVKPCNTQDVFYSHDSPYYSPYRGGCVCYSGDFICAKEDFTRGFKPDQTPTGSVCLLRMSRLYIPAKTLSQIAKSHWLIFPWD